VQDARKRLIEKVIIPVSRDEAAIVITGGTNAGVMAEVGHAVADLAPQLALLGVAPHGKLRGYGAAPGDRDAADPEPHHTLLRTAGSAWGDESRTLVRVAERVSSGRIAMVAVGGGSGTAQEVALALERKWPLVLVIGCGGTSEELGQWLQSDEHRQPMPVKSEEYIEPDELRDAFGDGRILLADVRDRSLLERDLRWSLSDKDLLREAWSRYLAADRLAVGLKPYAVRSTAAVISLAVATVLLALLLAYLKPQEGGVLWYTLKTAVTLLPILAAVLLGLLERAVQVGSWVEMRAAAESLLREIYRARAQAPPYDSEGLAGSLLSESLKQVDDRAGGRLAEDIERAASSAWSPRDLSDRVPVIDSLLGPLTPSVYDEARALQQADFLSSAADGTAGRARKLTLAIYTFGGLAAFFLAASWRENWAAAFAGGSASLLAAVLSWREYRQWDARAKDYRSTVLAIRATRAQWLSYAGVTRESENTLKWYVTSVETSLGAENADWERALRQAHQGIFDRYRGK
jgi:hypothetical protein